MVDGTIDHRQCACLQQPGEGGRGIEIASAILEIAQRHQHLRCGDGVGANINVPLPAGSGHGAYVETLAEVVMPALRAFQPELIVIASGFDANGFDPLGRMMCHSETYREMTVAIMGLAGDVCEGRLVVCQEGGYSPGYMPYCCLAVVETLSGIRTEVEDVRGAHLAGVAGQELQAHQADVIEAAAALLSA